MTSMFFKLAGRRESGQTIIFFAVVLSILMLSTGLAVEGGNVLVQYRKLQSAADMAATIGGQGLPCRSSDSACITNAERLACDYAAKNGFSGCVVGGTSVPSANVPPSTCSPYDFIDYGNDSSNPLCKHDVPPPFYDYIEVRLQKNVGTIPIFNVPVTLSAHVVAKNGIPSSRDYAVSILSNQPGALSLGGNLKYFVNGSTFSNGSISVNGNPSLIECAGGWFTASNSTAAGQLTSYSAGATTFAPPTCTGSTLDNPTNFNANLLPITDPYCSSMTPPTLSASTDCNGASGGNSFPNCPECQQQGYWYSLPSGPWHQGGTVSGNAELFPGIYDTLSPGNSDTFYFNPGVYSFNANVDTNHGTMCIFGSPGCGNLNCSTASFPPNSAAGDQWNYSCSPWGFWDDKLSRAGAPGGGPPVNAPTWFDKSTGAPSNVPLNGVTFYLGPGAGTASHGNGGKAGGIYLAFPNPCPGTGTSGTGAIQFPQGSSDSGAVFTYPTTSLAYQRGYASSPQGVVYPSSDLTLQGECRNSLNVWPGEMPSAQHLHFLWFDRNSSGLKLNGASAQDYSGIMYVPSGLLDVNGSGAAAGGPPWILGQIVAYTAVLSGNGTVDLIYRPCGEKTDPCGSGLGVQLMQ